jgi:hypothetical protein
MAHARACVDSIELTPGLLAIRKLSGVKVQQRYTHQLFPVWTNCSKLRSLNYLGLRLITLIFLVLSETYRDVKKLIIRWFQVQVLVGPLENKELNVTLWFSSKSSVPLKCHFHFRLKTAEETRKPMKPAGFSPYASRSLERKLNSLARIPLGSQAVAMIAHVRVFDDAGSNVLLRG